MIRAGMKLRAGCLALRIRWVEQVERERDEARASRDEARQLRQIAEARATASGSTARHLDEQIAETERVLTSRGYPHPGGGENLALAVDNALRGEARAPAEAGTILDAWQQVRRLVDESGIISPASIVDRVAVAMEERRARSRDGMTAMCPSCGTSQDLVVAEHTTSIEDGPGSENPPHTCWGSGIEAEHLPADVGGDGYVVDARIACSREVTVEVNCGDDDEHDGPCWPSPMSLAQRALSGAAVNRPDLLAQMRQVWAVVGASRDAGVDPVTELSQVRDALYAAGHPAIRGGFHPGKTVEAVQALVRQHDGTLRAAMKAEQARRAAYDPAMGGDIEPPPGREVPDGAVIRDTGTSWETGRPTATHDLELVERLAAMTPGDCDLHDYAVFAEGGSAGPCPWCEIARTRAVLAPDQDTTGTSLDVLAAAAIDWNRTRAVAAELRWWIAPGNSHAMAYGADADDMRTRAEALDPGGITPTGGLPPRPDVWAADREVEVPF